MIETIQHPNLLSAIHEMGGSIGIGSHPLSPMEFISLFGPAGDGVLWAVGPAADGCVSRPDYVLALAWGGIHLSSAMAEAPLVAYRAEILRWARRVEDLEVQPVTPAGHRLASILTRSRSYGAIEA